MKGKEKPIVRNNALRNERVLEDQRKQQVDNPYDDNEKRQRALQYLKDRKIHEPKRLRNSDD